jgi:transcriptional regulator with XRE-family HTH domain
MDDICAKTGLILRKYREKKGLSQEQLADAANLHRTYIGLVERGETNVTLRTLEKIAKVLGVAMRDLL